jgi:hypothetical protein
VAVSVSPAITTVARAGSRIEGLMESSCAALRGRQGTPRPQLRPRGGVVSRSGMAVRYARNSADNGGIGVRTKDARHGRPVDTAAAVPRMAPGPGAAYLNSCRAMIVRWISEAPS